MLLKKLRKMKENGIGGGLFDIPGIASNFLQSIIRNKPA